MEYTQKDLENFWAEHAKRIHWFKPFQTVKDTQFKSPVKISWFNEGETNVSFNCLDRHLEKFGDKTAIIWEPDSITEAAKKITFKELHAQVCRLSNVLKTNGVKKGDRVTIYMPMIPEAAVAMLACTRIGAIHSVIFGGFSPDSIAGRIEDCQSNFVITADEGYRGGKKIPLKKNVDAALAKTPKGLVKKVLVVKRSGADVGFEKGRDLWWHEEMAKASATCETEKMNAEDPLFILYTSGSTGKPKGVLHTTGGYLVYASYTHEKVFDLKPNDIYWCTADVGWITGHSYLVYGPLCNGATTLMFEGVPNYPDCSRFWQVVDKHQVSIFYTAPTAIRALMREGDGPVKKTSRTSLRVLGTVGEPINPEAWQWYHRVVGDGRCPVVDTYWQTETGGIIISSLAAKTDEKVGQWSEPDRSQLKPGAAAFPFFGVTPKILSQEGNILEGECEGLLVIADSWPGQMRTVYKDHDRFEKTYFSSYPGFYFTGDGCKRDADGFYWITGRVDDVLNISGHRLGTAEIESALVAHKAVAEAAVVGYPHDIKGQGIYAYVTLNLGIEPTDALKKEIIQWVGQEIGPIAKPELIQWAPALPKTRSGKIM
jgi:acetyl-CoA synthetase